MSTETKLLHTAEPWAVDNGHIISFNPDGKYIAKMTTEGQEDDAARIVACVNACAGMEDPAKAIEDVRAFLRMNLGHYQVKADALLQALGG